MKDDIALSRVLDQFLFEHPEPTSADWRALVLAQPQFREDIADFAATYQSGQGVSEEEVHSNFIVDEQSSKSLTFALKLANLNDDPLEVIASPDAQEELMHEFQLAEHEELVLGVLIGQVRAAKKIVEYIAAKAQSTVELVWESFDLRHRELEVSMSSRERPEAMPLLSWADEVERLVEDPAERKRLLALDS
ncbi:MAG: hypothetical protein JSR75_19835 [Proteobacteria bacterium]|nr:hypothetical protein [Pseudomonadota bacterium]